jgi:hypothetical protein
MTVTSSDDVDPPQSDDGMGTEEILRIVIVSTLFILISLAMCIYIFNKFCKCYFIAKKNRNGEQRRWFFLGQKDTQTPQGMMIDTPVMNQNIPPTALTTDITGVIVDDGTNRIQSDALVLRDPGMPIQSVYIDASVPTRESTPLLGRVARYPVPQTRQQQYFMRQQSLQQLPMNFKRPAMISPPPTPTNVAPAAPSSNNTSNQDKK